MQPPPSTLMPAAQSSRNSPDQPVRPLPPPSSNAARGPIPPVSSAQGKLDEIVNAVASTNASLVLFDHDLTPSQLRNIESRLSTATHSAVSSTSISRRCPEPLDPKGARVRSLCSECGVAVERRRRRLVPAADCGGGAGGTREAHLQPDPTPEVLKTRFGPQTIELRIYIEKDHIVGSVIVAPVEPSISLFMVAETGIQKCQIEGRHVSVCR